MIGLTQWQRRLRLFYGCAYFMTVLFHLRLSMAALTQWLCLPDDRTYPI